MLSETTAVDSLTQQVLNTPPAHEANGGVLASLLEIAEIIEKEEHLLSEQDRVAINNVCSSIDAVVQRDFSDYVRACARVPTDHHLPCAWPVGVALGLIPSVHAEAMRTFHDDIEAGKFRSFSSLQNGPLDIKRLSESLEPDSTLEWLAMSQSVEGQEDLVTKQVFLKQLSLLARLASDPENRHSEAVHGISRKHETLRTCPTLGDDIPIEIAPPTRGAAIELLGGVPALFGHSVQVYFSQTTKLWFLVSLSGQKLALSKGRKHQIPATKQGAPPREAYAFTSIQELAKSVKELKTNCKLTLLPVHSQKRPLGMHELPSYYGGGREYEFWGTRTQEPILISRIDEIEIKLESLFPVTGSAGKGQGWDLVTRLRGINSLCFSVASPVGSIKPVTHRDLSNYYGKLESPLKARRVLFEDGSSLVVFSQPLRLSRPSDLHTLEYNGKPKMQLFGLQSFTRSALSYPLFEYPELEVANRDFQVPKLRLDYDTVSKLDLKHPINRMPMQFAFSTTLAGMGFHANSDGFNVLSNLRDLYIPLCKPTERQFKHPLLQPIASLDCISAQDWPTLVASLNGGWILGLEDIAGPLPHRSSASSSDRNTDGQLPPAPKLGECFTTPRRGVTLYGPWQLSMCEVEGARFFIVDSPFYGNALFLYRSEAGASQAAEHLWRRGNRNEIRQFTGFVRRIVHDEGWRTRLTTAVYREILDKEPPLDAPELG